MASSEARLYQIFRELDITEYCVHAVSYTHLDVYKRQT